jgi:hypothetical protein
MILTFVNAAMPMEPPLPLSLTLTIMDPPAPAPAATVTVTEAAVDPSSVLGILALKLTWV